MSDLFSFLLAQMPPLPKDNTTIMDYRLLEQIWSLCVYYRFGIKKYQILIDNIELEETIKYLNFNQIKRVLIKINTLFISNLKNYKPFP
jgi:hypothetical protein